MLLLVHLLSHLQLYKELKKQIISGAYSYGERFPSKRATARDSGFSLITVQHAYEILCDEGWLTARERSGFYVSRLLLPEDAGSF